jgi:hypothetical protein
VLPITQIFPSAHLDVGAAVGGLLTGIVEGRLVGRRVGLPVPFSILVGAIVPFTGAADGTTDGISTGATMVTRSRGSGAVSPCDAAVSREASPEAPASNDECSPPRSCAPTTRKVMARRAAVDTNASFMAELWKL